MSDATRTSWVSQKGGASQLDTFGVLIPVEWDTVAAMTALKWNWNQVLSRGSTTSSGFFNDVLMASEVRNICA